MKIYIKRRSSFGGLYKKGDTVYTINSITELREFYKYNSLSDFYFELDKISSIIRKIKRY